MQILISAIGKMKKKSPQEALMHEYIQKTRWPITVKEQEEKRTLEGEALKVAESELLLASVPAGSKIIALDEGGQTLSSREFSSVIREWQDGGIGTIAFLIGGANGHADILKKQADLKLSFGRMTLPHMLARVVLAEQIYRAKSIIDNHPYHRD